MRQKRRVRFYVTASLLSADSVADRLISNDFATRIPPPAGEIPRKQPTPSASSPVASPRHEVKSTWREFFSDTQPPSSALPHIPPAGWTATPIIYAVPPTQPPALAYETNRLLARHHPSPPRRIVELRNMLFPATRLPEKGMLPTAEVPKSPTTTKGGRSSKKKPKMDS